MKVLLATSDFKDAFKEIFPDLMVYQPTIPSINVDLVIFTGGEDINPARYGVKDRSIWYNERRDRHELEVLSAIFEGIIRTKKVLGVCRGLQLLNIYNGGTLYADLPSVGKGHTGVHAIEWNDSVELLNDIKYVNSLHHQAVHKLGSRRSPTVLGFEPTTGIIEAVLWESYMLGVQFHPEWLPENARNKFFEDIEKWVNGKSLIKEKQNTMTSAILSTDELGIYYKDADKAVRQFARAVEIMENPRTREE